MSQENGAFGLRFFLARNEHENHKASSFPLTALHGKTAGFRLILKRAVGL